MVAKRTAKRAGKKKTAKKAARNAAKQAVNKAPKKAAKRSARRAAKRAGSRVGSRAENKTRPTSASVDGFIEAIASPRRRAEARIVLAMYREVTGLPPVMWGPSIIGFGIHHYRYESGHEGSLPAACFSPRESSLTFYVGSDFAGAPALYARLGKHRKSVACLYVNKLDDIDLDVLREIVAGQFASRSQYAKDV